MHQPVPGNLMGGPNLLLGSVKKEIAALEYEEYSSSIKQIIST